MNNEFQLIQHLYGERDEHFALRETLEANDTLHAEYQALSEAKFHVDHRRRQRPDAAVLDQIMAAAAHVSEPAASPALHTRQDRMARPHRAHHRRRMLSAVGLTMLLVCAMSVGFWQWSSTSAPVTPTVSAEVFESALTPLPTDGLATTAPQQVSDENVPNWEDDRVMELHKRIDRLQQRSTALQWDEPAMPLEMVPANTNRSPAAAARLQHATQRRR